MSHIYEYKLGILEQVNSTVVQRQLVSAGYKCGVIELGLKRVALKFQGKKAPDHHQSPPGLCRFIEYSTSHSRRRGKRNN